MTQARREDKALPVAHLLGNRPYGNVLSDTVLSAPGRGGSPVSQGGMIPEDRCVFHGKMPCAGYFACRARKDFVVVTDIFGVTEGCDHA